MIIMVTACMVSTPFGRMKNDIIKKNHDKFVIFFAFFNHFLVILL